MSKVTSYVNNIIRNAGWTKKYSALSDYEKYVALTGVTVVTEADLGDPDNESKLVWLIPGGIGYDRNGVYPNEPQSPDVVPNTPEQDAIQQSIIDQINGTSSTKVTINVDGTMNNVTIPEGNVTVTLIGEIQDGATIYNLSSKTLTIDNTGTEEYPNITIESPNVSGVTLKGQYNNVYFNGVYITASSAQIKGEVVFDSAVEGRGNLSVTADWVEDVKVISYNTNNLTIYNSTQDDVLENIEVMAPNATVTMGGEWNKVVASTGTDTLKLSETFHAKDLIVNKGSVIVLGADVEEAFDNITIVDGTCKPYTVSLGTSNKVGSTAGIYEITGDYSGTQVMVMGIIQKGHFAIKTNGHNVTTTKSNGGAFYQRGANNVVDIYAEGSTLTTAGYGYWIGTQGCVANIYGGHWISSVSAMYAEKGVINIYGGKFEVKEEDKSYVLNCYDSAYKAGTAMINVYGGEFVDFDPAHSPSEADSPSFVADGYKSVRIDEHIWKVVPQDEEIEEYVPVVEEPEGAEPAEA